MVNLRKDQQKDEKAASAEKYFILNKKDTEKDGKQTTH